MRLESLLAAALLAISLVSPANAGAPPPFHMAIEADHPLVGRIWSPATGNFTDSDELVREAAASNLVLLGETHDNPDHHQLQAWILRHMIAAGKRPAVAFEMIDSGQETALRKHLRERPDDDLGLGAAIGWDKTGWPGWEFYRPIATAAMAAGLPILTANMTKDDVRAIVAGKAAAQFLKSLRIDKPLAEAAQRFMEDDIQSSHCHMLPEKALPAMVTVQRARDAVMAEALVKGVKAQGSAVLIAGAGHARSDFGAPTHLGTFAADHKLLSVAFVEVQADKHNPEQYGELYGVNNLPFDLVWFTPRAQREDQCEAFRKHMEEKKKNSR